MTESLQNKTQTGETAEHQIVCSLTAFNNHFHEEIADRTKEVVPLIQVTESPRVVTKQLTISTRGGVGGGPKKNEDNSVVISNAIIKKTNKDNSVVISNAIIINTQAMSKV